MPKYSEFKVAGYYLYFTSDCILEVIHAHASDRKLTESGSAKFWVKKDGSTVIANKGRLNERELKEIQKYIKKNFPSICEKWKNFLKLNSIEDINFWKGN